MFEYYFVQIAGIWITEDGSSSGDPIISKIDGMGQFLTTRPGIVIESLSGNPHKQQRTHAGKRFTINFPVINETDFFEDVRAAVDALDEAGSAIPIVIRRRSTRTYTFTAVLVDIAHTGDFVADNMRDVSMTFAVKTLVIT